MASIMIDTRYTNPVETTQFYIQNNTLGTNTDVNIRVYKTYSTYAPGNLICNNGSSTVSVVTGIQLGSCTGH